MKSYWHTIQQRFLRRPWGVFGLVVLTLFFLIGVWAPFLASSKPVCVVWHNTLYFPLFRYLLSTAFFTKKIDIFFNLMGVLLIPYLATFLIEKWRGLVQIGLLGLFTFLFLYFGFFQVIDPATSAALNLKKEEAYIRESMMTSEIASLRYPFPSWSFELEYMTPYAKLNLILKERNAREQYERLKQSLPSPYTPFSIEEERRKERITFLEEELKKKKAHYDVQHAQEKKSHDPLLIEENEAYEEMENERNYLLDRQKWLDKELKSISFVLMPLIRPYTWEDDVGGDQKQNLAVPFFELSRITHQDLLAGLIFGSRISLLVGGLATLLALLIGIPLGLASGYYGARTDIVLSRFVEVWEAMPAFFMLLLVITILQTKSIFVVIAVIAIFGWTGVFRFVRAEVFRQREMLYVKAGRAFGFSDAYLLLHHILPNSLVVVLALLPFTIMAAITSEAALAFLGLGEELSCSWGVLMDEGRAAFPAQSRLLWPPAAVLTILLIAIAFVGEAIGEAIDPKA